MKLINAFVLAICLTWVSSSLACESDYKSFIEVRGDGSGLVKGPFSVEEVEEQFGETNHEWKRLKDSMMPNDEIFWVLYSERNDSNEGTSFYGSYVLVRNGCVVQTLTTDVVFEGDERT